MSALRVESPVLRGMLAMLAAAAVSSVAMTARFMPGWLSPSNIPHTPGELVLGALAFSGVDAVLLGTWLLPGCIVVQWVSSRRNVRGIGSALLLGGFVSAAACATLFVPGAMLEWPPSGPDLMRKLPPAVECVLFVVAWFLAFEMLSPAIGDRDRSPAEPPSLKQRAGRTTAETLAIVSASLWVLILGSIGGAFMDFGGDGRHRLESSVDSPRQTTRAHVVSYATPGGALGHTQAEVYLLPTTDTWSEKHRGLLVWSARKLDIATVEWDSEDSLRVRVQDDPSQMARYARPFSREGFTVRTEAAAAR